MAKQTEEVQVSVITTSFKQYSAPATDVNGTTWKDLLDKSVITKPSKIWGFTVTAGGSWAGSPCVRITDGAGNKIFPYKDEWVESADFFSGDQAPFYTPVEVTVSDGYKFQFRSTSASDGASETLELDDLDVVEVG